MKALISVTRRVRLTSVVEMSEEEFARLDAALDGERDESRAAEKELNEWIDPTDWVDDDLDSLEEFRRYTPPDETGGAE